MTDPTIQITLQSDLALIAPDVPTQRTLEIAVTPPAAPHSAPRPRLNLALVIDRSGSMSGEKIQSVRQAAQHLVDMLDEQDRVAVVAYDDDVTLVADSTLITRDSRQMLKERIRQIKSGGMTNLSGGWLAGCEAVAAQHAEGQLERALLLTDGQANQGITALEELAVHARELSKRGVSTSTFGVGQDFNEHLLEAMATAGGGMYHYISTPYEIGEIFNREFSELATITARDVEITLEAPAGVAVQVLGSWQVETDKGRTRIYLGALQAGRPQPVFVSLLTPPAAGAADIQIKARVMGLGNANQVHEAAAELAFHYGDAQSLSAALPDRNLLARGSQVRIAEAVNQALKMERAGERERAYQHLIQAIELCREHLTPQELQSYQQMAERMRRGMQEGDRKSSQHLSYMTRRGRN